MASLPIDLVEKEILPRCAARSLLRFKCASRSFDTLISSPEFINLHLKNCQTSNSNRLLVLKTGDCISCYDLNSLDMGMFSLPLPKRVTMIGTCSGLICISLNNSCFMLINPCTGTFTETHRDYQPIVGEFVHENDCFAIGYLCYGFGYDSSNDAYKAVFVLGFGHSDGFDGTTKVVFVYNFQTDSWRSVMSPRSSLDLAKQGDKGALINNHLLHLLFWCPQNAKHHICCFDLEAEQWVQDVPLPDYDVINPDSHFADQLFATMRNKMDDVVHLGVFEKCLCLLIENPQNRAIDVWVMKEYGVKESWVKLLGVSSVRSCPLAYRSSEKNEVLLKRNDLEFGWYNITDQSYQTAEHVQSFDQLFRGFAGHLDALICDQSLVALRDGQLIPKEQQRILTRREGKNQNYSDRS